MHLTRKIKVYPTEEQVSVLWTLSEQCRDRNSAINTMERFLLQNALWTGYQQFVDNLRQKGLPIGIRFLEPKTQMR